MLKTEILDSIVDELFLAEKHGKAIPKLVDRYPELDVHLAYEVQNRLIERKCRDEGTKIVGWKLGLTSKAKQEMMGVHEPTYGVLLENMQLKSDGSISLKTLIHPKIEPEIAFIFKEELKGPGVTVAEVLQKTAYIAPALEIIDSRYQNFSFTLADVIADNSSSSRFILGERFTKYDGEDLSLIGMVFKKNGAIVSTSAGASVMGHPVRAIAWMVNKLSRYDQSVKPGEVVLSGALTGAVEIKEGDVFSMSLDRFGSVEASFTFGKESK
ncbi:4-oxalocrotonate decarboxylase [Geobacillus sp. NFOSA3]|uniref:4-oxalocrotonate decarboxylase n=1 Tax=Parageobacillus galactosidasius TaxID=883812 RepID=A0A226QKR2_9BACL|nr:fumarylacetoacetate hydrolase family protein [Parageobacillus galactosidasius]NNU94231.1 4-oxalocrotonate decarboxylase [Geobacillus sp. NFOSA3]OQP01180.1 4-oxalocrotonate decarboxylase [Geobacillus sp. 44C]OXB92032.1 4-oxalocrotonate decarboxylase [Parageobacillus galactosidasius]QNU34668.1 fumarylacetoacetate hydrolase family protein [Geobacillus sp. 44C]